MGQHGSNWGHVGPGGSKWWQHGLKWVQKRLKAVKVGKSGQRGSNRPQNGPKCPFAMPNCISRQPGGSPALWSGHTRDWDRSTEGIHSRFTVLGKSVHRVPLIPDVHRVTPTNKSYTLLRATFLIRAYTPKKIYI